LQPGQGIKRGPIEVAAAWNPLCRTFCLTTLPQCGQHTFWISVCNCFPLTGRSRIQWGFTSDEDSPGTQCATGSRTVLS
jgi:hypothetical protein